MTNLVPLSLRFSLSLSGDAEHRAATSPAGLFLSVP
jgi:hypothetical protein